MGYTGSRLAPLFTQVPSRKAAHALAARGRDEMHKRTVQETAIDDSPFPSRTPGTARKSWQRDPIAGPIVTPREEIYETGIRSDDPVTTYLEYGTGEFGPYHRPYVIRPKDPEGMLSFYSRKTGNWVLAKSVLHPGIHPQRPLATGVTLTEHVLPEISLPILEKMIREVELHARTAPKVHD